MKAPSMRLDRLLANLGYGSRRDINNLARAQAIRLDGQPLTAVEARLVLDAGLAQRLSVAGEPLDPLPGLALMLHKPVGVTCSHNEAGPLVHGLLPERWRRRQPPLSSVGRLDKDTSGLLLLTDDGALLHRIIAPKSVVTKRYRVALARPLRGTEAAVLASGTLMLAGETKPLLPAAMTIDGPLAATVELTEGRYHQVRRMFAALGNHVTALHRDRVGALELPEDLAAGSYAVLGAKDLAKLFGPFEMAASA